MDRLSRIWLPSFILIIIFLFFGGTVLGATPEAEQIIRLMEMKKNRAVTVPKIKKGKLKTGLKYYILPDHELPITKAMIYIKGGDVYDPLGQSGLTEITVNLIRNGGTKELSPQEVDELLDNIASIVDVSSSGEYIHASISCRSEHFERSLNVLLDMFFSPRFDHKRFDLIKKQLKNAVKRRADSPEKLAAVGFFKLLYGQDNAWGQYPTQASVDSITLEDVKNYHKDYFHPGRMIIGITGDIKSGKAIRLLRSYKDYPKISLPEVREPAARPVPIPGVHILDKESNQAVFNIGHAGSTRFNPDKYALIIMNYILGGSPFKTRLPALIRVEKGLAYSVWSSYQFGPTDAPGIFEVYLATKTPTALEGLDLAISEIKRFVLGDDITVEEVERSKKSILEKLIFEYNNSYDIVSGVARFNYFGYPDNYIEIYGQKIGEIELDDVKRVAKKYLHPDKLQTVVVGDGKKLKEQFKDHFKTNLITIDN